FFFQAEDGLRGKLVTGVQTCALPISSDIEYEYPIGWSELEGVANRGDFDLTQHAQFSTTKLEYVGPDGERYVPHVIEPAVSIERSEEHTSELQSLAYLVCRLLLEKKK